jgi:hypothetical protein
MFQKTFIRFTLMVAFSFTVAILLMAFRRQQAGCEGGNKPVVTKPAVYGEYIIWESLGSTILSINQ